MFQYKMYGYRSGLQRADVDNLSNFSSPNRRQRRKRFFFCVNQRNTPFAQVVQIYLIFFAPFWPALPALGLN